MENITCAAKRELVRARAERKSSRPPSPSTCRQISGVIVPPPGTNQFGAPQVLQKSVIGAVESRVVELNDQAVGVSKSSVPLKDYSAFNQNADNPDGVLSLSPNGGGITESSGMSSNARPEQLAGMQTQANGTKMMVSRSGILYALHMLREPVAEYQETRGVPKNEEITFVALITSLCTQAYTAAITILVMIWNLMPLVDGLLYFVRFCLDKLIDIVQTTDNKDRAIKLVILSAEVTLIMLIIFLIVGLIFMPVYELTVHLCRKVLSMVAW